ncbi:MAG: TonB-dependent receptor SusC [Candidatus Ordinivivax streblomastigis]|uniref:TonB-dependent receptor SusC n=1 Tax=Candidatus Ordinivivax streblomastigis TaxID=2540710 RepID=A0A5M8P658_9BACT|nr:MAG: TonB-dependent receptor SusC [Candidatus Ordinivivax streblomastigis]
MKNKKRRPLFFLLLFFAVVQIQAQKVAIDTIVTDSPSITQLQSISTVDGDRLLHRPVFQMEQFLDGTLPGLAVDLTNGYPTASLGLSMRQRNLLIVVDGIPRADVNLTPNQIESVSILKDGLGLAIWGMSSGDGILSIKTKRGVADKIKIDFTAQYAQHQQINRPKILDAYAYGNLLNEAAYYDNEAVWYAAGSPDVPVHNLVYSEQDLELYKNGSSPYTHPNNDWYSILMRDIAPIQQYNLNLSGGSEGARYFIDLNMYDQQGFLKQDKTLNAYDTREGFKKWSMRTSVDVNLTKNTLFSINLFGQMFRETTPGTSMSTLYSEIHKTPANAYPVFNPPADLDKKGIMKQTYGGNSNFRVNDAPFNLYAASVGNGYVLYPKTDLNFDIALEHHFTNALKGLYVKGLYSYNSSYREIRTNAKHPDIWQYTPIAGKEINDPSNYNKIYTGTPPSRSSTYSRQNRLQYVDLHTGYDFTFGLNSSKTKLTYWNNQFVAIDGYLPMYKQGFNLHSEYDYNKKYLAEISLSTNSLNYLKPGHQWGFFPAAGLGWNIAAEDFFRVDAINTLKLRTTLGLNGNDGTGSFLRGGYGNLGSYYYTYIPTYKSGGSIVLGQSSTSYSTLVEDHLPYITQWEKSLRFVLGVDVEALDKSLKVGVEYFNNHHFDILAVDISKNYSGLLGIDPVATNMAAYRQQGLEFDVTYQKQFGDFSLIVNPLLTLYKSITLKNGEPKYPEPYMQLEGRMRGNTHGYQADGFFQSQTEIDNYLLPKEEGGLGYYLDGYTPQPGDIKYKDLNGDFNIDALDQDEIYSHVPRIEYGIYFNAGWKGLNLSMQWSGVGNSQISTQSYSNNMPFSRNGTAIGNAYEPQLDYWRPDNPNASYPRLTAGTNSWNTRTSTFWVKDNSYLRLKNIELSYSLPQNWMQSIHLSNVKVFVNAYNALTFTPLKYVDPEMPNAYGSNVPNFKAYNAGINVQF